jgi:hypothetical protein
VNGLQCSTSCPGTSCVYVLAACHTHSMLHHLLIPRGVEEERVKDRRHLSTRPHTHAPFPLRGCVMHLTACLLMQPDASISHLRGLHERQRRITVGLFASDTSSADTSSAQLMPSPALIFPTMQSSFKKARQPRSRLRDMYRLGCRV